ncbi:unnamed protein product [Prorocentrum cordatum]|uniref:Uncharacterized protein n=1 Tax=Prorocentrum cordatum TaxID=2364126 RepID=A0ABN9SZ72_9DINO|nr:unnamed protein product [Polarella glacialis]
MEAMEAEVVSDDEDVPKQEDDGQEPSTQQSTSRKRTVQDRALDAAPAQPTAKRRKVQQDGAWTGCTPDSGVA